jgi:hypothetical protein
LRSRILAEEELVEDIEDASHHDKETVEAAESSKAKIQPLEPEIQTIDEEEIDKETDEVNEDDDKEFDEDDEVEEDDDDEDDDIASIQSEEHDKVNQDFDAGLFSFSNKIR